MSYKSYAYDPQGNRHETYVKDGKTYTSSGDRLGAGWTSQTAGGIYKMGNDGNGYKVDSHNTIKPVTPSYSGSSRSNNSSSYSDNYSSGSGSSSSSYRSDGYSWHDPNDYSHVVISNSDGNRTTVSKEYADKYAGMGYDILAPSKGAARWDIEQALRNNTVGSEWVDNGYNNGKILMQTGNGGFASVDPVYADKYFNKGYTLDARSQSINRALLSGYHQAVNAANGAIRGGSYNANKNYSRDFGYVEGRGYKFDNSVMDQYMQPQFNSISPQGSAPQVVSTPEFINPVGQTTTREIGNGSAVEKTESNKWRVNIGGQIIELDEDDYIQYMLKLLNI